MFSLLVLAAMLTARRENETNKKTRIEIIKQLEKDRSLLPLVKKDFIENGESVISDYYKIYNHSEKEINDIYRKSKSIVKKEKHNYKNTDYYIIQSDYNCITSMIEKGYLIQRADDSIHYNIEAKQSVITLFKKLTDEGIIYRYSNDITHLM